MSTRGSIVISGQRYRGKGQSGQRPQAVAHPGIADHVRLYGENKRRCERGCDADREPPPSAPRGQQDADEDRKPPRDPEQGTD
jgi:hypothetical protein